ncbi:MerR family transcriptional regulator [Clostridium pasteurianum]|uniref:MerR family transcriptional regulator n=1 Tax=Clostridium pasteurianum TaxID=1501 RepID=UPI003D6D425D
MKIVSYSISQVAKKFHLEAYTLRYYEKEGILSPQKTEKGIRYFTNSDLEELEMICCLKSTGMSLKDIKKYFDLCAKGDETLEHRMEIFTSHRNHILQEMEQLQKHLEKIQKKIQWYSGYMKSRRKK